MKNKYNSLYRKEIFNILIIISTIIYCFSFLAAFSNQTRKIAAYEQLFETLFYQTNEYNSNILRENNNFPSVDQAMPIFFNAKEAVATAYENLNRAVSYEFQSFGVINITVHVPGGMQVQVFVHVNVVQFPNGNYMIETKRYEEGNANQQTKSSFKYYTPEGKYEKFTNNVTRNPDNTLTATYSKDFKFFPDNKEKRVDIVVDRSTIIKDLFFRINYDQKGEINSYSASVNLNTSTAVVNGYAENIKLEGGCDEIPKFTKLEVNCIIDSEGNLASMRLLETYESTVTFGFPIKITCNDTFNYYFTNMNKTPSIPEPTV